MWSRRLDNGAVVEMGAEFLLPGNTAIRALAERFGLGLWDKGMRYQRLALALADAVRLRAPVRRASHGAGGVRVGTAEGELEAEVCVIAVPVPALERIELDPPLPRPSRGSTSAASTPP